MATYPNDLRKQRRAIPHPIAKFYLGDGLTHDTDAPPFSWTDPLRYTLIAFMPAASPNSKADLTSYTVASVGRLTVFETASSTSAPATLATQICLRIETASASSTSSSRRSEER